MRRHTERHFGYVLDPAPNDLDVNRLIQVQLLSMIDVHAEDYRIFGPKFSAAQIDDLIHVLQHARKILETESHKTPEGYWPRRAF